MYESPHCLIETLKQIAEFIGEDGKVCVVRELTKIHETFHRGSVKEQIDFFVNKSPKGEIVLVLEGL